MSADRATEATPFKYRTLCFRTGPAAEHVISPPLPPRKSDICICENDNTKHRHTAFYAIRSNETETWAQHTEMAPCSRRPQGQPASLASWDTEGGHAHICVSVISSLGARRMEGVPSSLAKFQLQTLGQRQEPPSLSSDSVRRMQPSLPCVDTTGVTGHEATSAAVVCLLGQARWTKTFGINKNRQFIELLCAHVLTCDVGKKHSTLPLGLGGLLR